MKGDLGELVKRLQAMLADLATEDALGQDGQKTVELDQQSVGRLSRMDALISQSMSKAQQTRRDQAKRRIHAALARVTAGDYGFCTDCGDEIGFKRLAVDPTLPRCLSCTRG